MLSFLIELDSWCGQQLIPGGVQNFVHLHAGVQYNNIPMYISQCVYVILSCCAALTNLCPLTGTGVLVPGGGCRPGLQRTGCHPCAFLQVRRGTRPAADDHRESSAIAASICTSGHALDRHEARTVEDNHRAELATLHKLRAFDWPRFAVLKAVIILLVVFILG